MKNDEDKEDGDDQCRLSLYGNFCSYLIITKLYFSINYVCPALPFLSKLAATFNHSDLCKVLWLLLQYKLQAQI